MNLKTVRLESDDGRWLELRVESLRAFACVGAAEPFPFSFEHLGYVGLGLGYQAWGAGSHMVFRPSEEGVVVEFQGPNERFPALCRMSMNQLRATVDALNLVSNSRATVL